jgi:hypothetical protein
MRRIDCCSRGRLAPRPRPTLRARSRTAEGAGRSGGRP